MQTDIFISHKNILELSWTNNMTQPPKFNLSYTLKKDSFKLAGGKDIIMSDILIRAADSI